MIRRGLLKLGLNALLRTPILRQFALEKQVPVHNNEYLFKLINELREETAPFTYEVQEPKVSLEDFNKSKQLNRVFSETLQLGDMKGAHQAATALLDHSLAIYHKGHPAALSAFNNLALVLQRNAQYVEAKSIFISVYEGYTRLLGREHAHSQVAMKNLATTLRLNQEFDQALKLFDELLLLKEVSWENRVFCYMGKAICFREQQRYQEALDLLTRTIDECVKLNNGDSQSLTVANLETTKGLTLKRMKRYSEAEQEYLKALETRGKLLPSRHPDHVASLVNLRVLHEEAGEGDKTDLYRRKVADLMKLMH